MNLITEMQPLATPFLFQQAEVRTATDEKGEAWFCGRVDRTIARSGPPQIRACAIDALGSSTVRFTRRTLGARFSLAVTGVSATVALPSPTGTILSVIAS